MIDLLRRLRENERLSFTNEGRTISVELAHIGSDGRVTWRSQQRANWKEAEICRCDLIEEIVWRAIRESEQRKKSEP